MLKKLKCPLCGEKMEADVFRGTSIWRCPKCPFVGFEYFHENDALIVAMKLKKD